MELNRKSQMVSEAVEEVLTLVQDATQKFKSMMSTDSAEDTAQGHSLCSILIFGSQKRFVFMINCFILFHGTDESRTNTIRSKENGEEGGGGGGGSANQSQDWSILWSCFENPVSLLSVNNNIPRGMKEMVSNAVAEMRRYYSRKVIDVLIKVTRSSLDMLRKRFIVEEFDADSNESSATKPKSFTAAAATATKLKPIYLVHSTLMIPNVAIRPTLEDLQEALIVAGKNITGVAKGVAQWTSGKEVVVKNK